MNYRNLFQSSTPIKTGLIGTGDFGNSFLSQTRLIPRLEAVAICDLDLDTAHQACLRAGWPEAALIYCRTEGEAQSAVAAGNVALVEDAQLLISLPIDIVIEATGMPEAGAAHAQAALAVGKHVVMVTKETDCVVGPILTRMAAERGLIYSQTDGDQPSMLIRLIAWAETLGMEVISAGKSSERDLVYDVKAQTIGNSRRRVNVGTDLADDGLWRLWGLAVDNVGETVAERQRSLYEQANVIVADLCEMAIVMNATGYGYDTPTLHAPVVHLTELAEVWAPRTEGGILSSVGVIDVIKCLRRHDEISFAGGVFAVLSCHDQITWEMLRGKGHIVSQDLARVAIFLPYHLLGVETATTIFSAVDLKLPTGGLDVQPRVDVGVIATESLTAGQALTMSKGHVIPGTRPELMSPMPIADGNPIPYYMAAENRLNRDVPVGTMLTYDMIDHDPDSALWALRKQQDAVFL